MVVETGSAVTELSVGDRVCLEPGITCGQCEFCKSGKYNLCPAVEFLATPPYHGAFRDYLAFPENMCFKLPANVTTLEGALVEPPLCGTACGAPGQCDLREHCVVILGAGCIGLCTLLACRAYGATNVIVVDVLENRLAAAYKLGATHVINAAEHDAVAYIDELTNGRGADVVVETAGAVVTVQQTSYLVKRGGTIVLVGMAPQDTIEFNFAKILAKEAQIQSVFRYRNLYPTAIQALASGMIDLKGIVTHQFEFDALQEALDFVTSNKRDVVKAIIKF